MKRKLFLLLLLCVSAFGYSQTFDNIPTGSGYYINKLIVSPNGSDLTNELIEIRGTPNEVIPDDLWLIAIEGDANASNYGRVSEEIQLGDGTRQFGANGILVIVCDYTDENTFVLTTNPYADLISPDATVLTIALTGDDVTGSSSSNVSSQTPDIGYDGNFSDATASYMLIQGSDPDNVFIDGPNAGDGLPFDGVIDASGPQILWTLYDSVAYMDDDNENGGPERTYAQIVFAQDFTINGVNQTATTSANVIDYNFGTTDPHIIIRQGTGTGYTIDDWAIGDTGGDSPDWIMDSETLPASFQNWDGINTVYGALNPPSSDASLSDLTSSLGTLDPVFNSATLAYTVLLPSGTTASPTVAGVANEENAMVDIVQATDVTSSTEAERTATVTVTAEDMSTELIYTVVFNVDVNLSTETEIIAFSFAEQTEDAIIDNMAYTVNIEVAYNTDLTTLVADFTLSDFATANIGGTEQESTVTENDFTMAVVYNVIAEDGMANQDWTVTVTEADPSTDASLSNLTSSQGTLDPVFNSATLAYTVLLASGTTASPTVAGVANDDNAMVDLVQATDVTSTTEADRTATVTVTAEDMSTELIYTVVFDVAVSVNDLASKGISIYPNPSNGTLTINVENNFKLEVFDLIGKVVNTKVLNENSTISIEDAGVYFLRFSNENGSVTQKVIVQ